MTFYKEFITDCFQGDVTKQECHGDLDPRLSYSGNYEQHECSITITGLQQGDAGEWSCEVCRQINTVFTSF